MGRKLYVGNLSFGVSDDALREAFEASGHVESVLVVKDRMTGQPRGFAFVEMGSDEEAQRAISTLNGQEIDGRAVVVNEARPREEGGGGSRGGFGRGPGLGRGPGGNRGGGGGRGPGGGGGRSSGGGGGRGPDRGNRW